MQIETDIPASYIENILFHRKTNMAKTAVSLNCLFCLQNGNEILSITIIHRLFAKLLFIVPYVYRIRLTFFFVSLEF